VARQFLYAKEISSTVQQARSPARLRPQNYAQCRHPVDKDSDVYTEEILDQFGNALRIGKQPTTPSCG
jgi:hypothetical protein